LEKAVTAEFTRQEKAILAGEKLIQETRGYDEVKQITFSRELRQMLTITDIFLRRIYLR